jgi:predicted amidohydrolase
MNVVAVQFDIVWEDKPANFEKVRRLLTANRLEKDSLVALPEMFATGFSMNPIADEYGGPVEQFLGATAREFGIWLVAGAAMRNRSGQARNKALVFSPAGELTAYYAKMRPFAPGGEKLHYVAGNKPTHFRCGEWTVSPFVCYDLRFPEIFREATAAWRPELFVVIANWPEKRILHWVRLLQARAIENQAYVLGVNRVGSDPHYAYPGRSIIVDPQGEILADAEGGECAVSAKLDLTNLRKYREGLPFLDDMTLAAAK